MGVAQRGDEGKGHRGDRKVADGRHAGAVQVDRGALVDVACHQAGQRGIGQVERGVDHSGAEIVGDENVDSLRPTQ